jgi:hypothetical protein
MTNSVPFRIPTGAELARMSPEALDRVFQRLKARNLPIAERHKYYDSVRDCLRLHAENLLPLADEAKRRFHELFNQ